MVTLFFCYFYNYYLASFGKKSFFLVLVGFMDSYSQVTVTVCPFLIIHFDAQIWPLEGPSI